MFWNLFKLYKTPIFRPPKRTSELSQTISLRVNPQEKLTSPLHSSKPSICSGRWENVRFYSYKVTWAYPLYNVFSHCSWHLSWVFLFYSCFASLAQILFGKAVETPTLVQGFEFVTLPTVSCDSNPRVVLVSGERDLSVEDVQPGHHAGDGQCRWELDGGVRALQLVRQQNPDPSPSVHVLDWQRSD